MALGAYQIRFNLLPVQNSVQYLASKPDLSPRIHIFSLGPEGAKFLEVISYSSDILVE